MIGACCLGQQGGGREEGKWGFWCLINSVTLHHSWWWELLWEPVETETSIQLPLGTEKWGGYVRTLHLSESGERGLSWKRWVGVGRSCFSPFEILQVFPGSSGFPVSSSSCLWSLFCCPLPGHLQNQVQVLSAFVYRAHPDVPSYSTPAPVPHSVNLVVISVNCFTKQISVHIFTLLGRRGERLSKGLIFLYCL